VGTLAAIALASCIGTGSRPVYAAIIYQDIPDITLAIPPSDGTVSAGIDFLGDGSNEFTLFLTRGTTAASATSINFGVSGSASTIRVLTHGSGIEANWATRFASGDTIVSPGTSQIADMYYNESPAGVAPRGDWLTNPGTSFVGLVINGIAGPNYGWARVTSTFGGSFPQQLITLHDFAFEGTPFASITAGVIPAPGVAAVLAVGGLVAAKRNRGGKVT
jgi:hypothetical protein